MFITLQYERVITLTYARNQAWQQTPNIFQARESKLQLLYTTAKL